MYSVLLPRQLLYLYAVGTAVNHIQEFRKSRDAKLVREVMETNRLVIRLEKVWKLAESYMGGTSVHVQFMYACFNSCSDSYETGILES